jgi:hypothetical protein
MKYNKINESAPGYSYHNRLFMVQGNGRLDDTLWISNSPGSGNTQPIKDYKTALSDHPEFSKHTSSSYFVELFVRWKSSQKPLKSKKIYGGVMEIYQIPVYPLIMSGASWRNVWNTSMAAYDIYNVNSHTNFGVHIPETDIVKPIKFVYAVYSQQKNIFIHIMKTKNEAMAWFNSTTSESSDIDTETSIVTEANMKNKAFIWVTNTLTNEVSYVGSFAAEGDANIAFDALEKAAPKHMKYSIRRDEKAPNESVALRKLPSPTKFLFEKRMARVNESEKDKLFGEQIRSIDKWFDSQTEHKLNNFLWNGKSLQILDKDDNVIDELTLDQVKSKISDFPEK